jgi:nucleoside-diphosphate-sugar epimerase
MKLLVLGATGFIGGAVYRLAQQIGIEVYGTGLSASAKFLVCDVRDRKSISEAISAVTPDVVVQCAAVGATAHSAFRDLIQEVNVVGTYNLIEVLTEYQKKRNVRLVNIGSSRAIRPELSHEFQGGTGLVYSRSKTESSRAVIENLRDGGEGADLAVHNTYGPGQPEGRFVTTLIQHAKLGIEMKLLNPHQVHDFVHVDDVARAVIKAAEIENSPSESIEIGTGIGTSVEQLAKMAYQMAGAPLSLITTSKESPAGLAEVADVKKAHELLGWRAEISLALGCKQMIDLAKT